MAIARRLCEDEAFMQIASTVDVEVLVDTSDTAWLKDLDDNEVCVDWTKISTDDLFTEDTWSTPLDAGILFMSKGVPVNPFRLYGTYFWGILELPSGIKLGKYLSASDLRGVMGNYDHVGEPGCVVVSGLGYEDWFSTHIVDHAEVRGMWYDVLSNEAIGVHCAGYVDGGFRVGLNFYYDTYSDRGCLVIRDYTE